MEPLAGRADPHRWARQLGVSRAAVDLFVASAPIDLHVESFIWSRVFGYDLARRHDRVSTGGRLFGQFDLPRAQAAGLSGAFVSIATNPFRTRRSRRAVLVRNVARLQRAVVAGGAHVVADAKSLDDVNARGGFGCFLAVQGANAFRADDIASPVFDTIARVTLVHLTRSVHGAPSAPGGGGGGLRAEGRRVVAALAGRSIILDLAHASPRTFWDALDVHGRDTPLVVSHTGACAVHDSWRNLDDDQIAAIAARGGAIGVILQQSFLTRPGWRADAGTVVAHLEHLVQVGGESVAALGTDYDGFIVPPRDLRSVLALPRVVHVMLERGWPPARVAAVLRSNALRVVQAVRPGDQV